MEEKVVAPDATPPAPAAPVSAPVVDDSIDIDQFMKVKFRVARIEHAEAVPKSNKLLKLQIDLGPLGKRQILSGIAKFYTPETLVGKKIIVVANLKPAKLMGIDSQGMLLAASSDDGSLLVLADPGQNMPEGSVVR
ncbi:MAG: methionine--tRNA ligase subunit beta [Deltaproteobacteria bacterium]|nr:methionine--tRNA ligase subunit beta [Deltaproteobacteria bacterium]